jgi:hypothetical protein
MSKPKRMGLEEWEERHKAPAVPEPQTWFTPKQAAAYLNMGLSTLAKMRGAQEGPTWCAPRPNSVRYHRDALDSWMKSQAAQ